MKERVSKLISRTGPANVMTLQQRRADARALLAEISNTIIAEDRALGPVERTCVAQLTLFINQQDRAILEAEAADTRDLAGAHDDPDAAVTRAAEARAGIHRGSVEFGGTPRGVTGMGTSARDVVAALYGSNRHNGGGFTGAVDFVSSVISGRHDPRLQASSQGEYSGPLGGFLLPTAIEAEIMTLVLEQSIFGGRAQFRTMTASEQSFPAFSTETDGVNGTFHGLSREWLPETTAATPQVATLETMTMKAHTQAIVVKISNQLLQDAPTFEGQLLQLIAGAVNHFMDVDCLSGVGTGTPLGVLQTTAAITVAKETGQAADTVLYDNVVKMWSRLAPSSAQSAIWLAPPSALPQLETMSIAVGTGGAPVRALRETNGRYFLMGRELIVTHKVKPVGDLGDVVLFDPVQFLIAIRAGMSVARSEHLGFLSNETYIRMIMRYDAKPTWRKAFSPGDSHPSVSPYVLLAERA